MPPASSTQVVSRLTAVPPAGHLEPDGDRVGDARLSGCAAHGRIVSTPWRVGPTAAAVVRREAPARRLRRPCAAGTAGRSRRGPGRPSRPAATTVLAVPAVSQSAGRLGRWPGSARWASRIARTPASLGPWPGARRSAPRSRGRPGLAPARARCGRPGGCASAAAGRRPGRARRRRSRRRRAGPGAAAVATAVGLVDDGCGERLRGGGKHPRSWSAPLSHTVGTYSEYETYPRYATCRR